MGKYATSGTGNTSLNPVVPTVLWPGDSVYVFGLSYAPAAGPTPGQIQAPNDANVQAEAVVVGERSLAIALAPRPGGGSPAGLAVLLIASGAPGAAEIDVQNSPTDADGLYGTPNNAIYKITAFPQNGGLSAYSELQPEGDNFVSLKVVANPNGVNWIAKLTYV